MAGVMLLSRSTCPCESMHGHVRTFSEQVITSVQLKAVCWKITWNIRINSLLIYSTSKKRPIVSGMMASGESEKNTTSTPG